MKRREFLNATAGLAALGVTPLGRAQAAVPPCPPPTAMANGGSASQTVCPPVGTPKYMSGMADFAVRNLTGVYAPSNGNVSMFSALPSEWQVTGQPNGAFGVFQAWGGGKGDAAGRRLFVHGGGHYDSSNNGLYIYDFNGDAVPTGWNVAPNSLSALSLVVANSEQYSDNYPTAIHTYDQLWYDPVLSRFYRYGGSRFSPAGDACTSAFYYDVSAGCWNTNLPSNSSHSPFFHDAQLGTLGGTMIGAPDGSKILTLPADKQPMFISSSGAKLALVGDAFEQGSQIHGPAIAYDSSRNRYVAFQSGWSPATIQLITVDWSRNTFTTTQQNVDANGLPLDTGLSVVYDGARDSFWIFGGSDQSANGSFNSISEISASTFALLGTHTFAGGATIGYGGSLATGNYNRHVWFSDWRVICTCAGYDQPVSIIKLP